MHWLFLVLAAIAMAIALKAASVAVSVLALLAALGLLVAWLIGVLAARIEQRSGAATILVDPAELQRLREQAEARRLAAGTVDGLPPREPPAG